MKITDLKPTIVWKFFHQVTQVPRPSKKEGKMIEFLESFAKEYKIAIKKDEAGNLLMSKPATPGMEDRPVVVLQSHMDMVCEKNNGTKHDFDNDPIETIVDGEWLPGDSSADNHGRRLKTELNTRWKAIFRIVPSKIIASYLGITEQSLSRIKRSVLKNHPKKED